MIRMLFYFEKQSEVDYFINKNTKEFLKEQFNIWIYQYVFSGESEWTEKRIKQLQILRGIAFKIIDFISQFEDDAFGGGAADTVVVIAAGSVHGDGDGSDDIDRKVNRKINADPY